MRSLLFSMNLKSDSCTIISVVRDWTMYGRCVADNANLEDCKKEPLDNRRDNERIPVLYNRFIERFNGTEDQWLVFCHEDFRLLESLAPWLDKMDKGIVYGPIGGVLSKKRHWLFGELWSGAFRGVVVESEKDGAGARDTGFPVPFGTQVDTVDCQCVIVHSSLVAKCRLRFDERLSFDLYAEDFCMNAFLAHGIKTCVLPVKCQHFSRGTIAPRFFEQLAYLDRKYPKHEAFGSVGYMVGGGRTVMRRIQKKVRKTLSSHFPSLVRLLLNCS